MISFLVTLAVIIVVMALIYWVLGQIPGMPAVLTNVWLVVCVVVLIVWLLSAFGLLSGVGNVSVLPHQ